MRDAWKTALVCALLVAAIAGLYGKVGGYPFIHLDDNIYVSMNPRVNTGISADNIRWSFTFSNGVDGEKPYWHPLAWISHMIDCELFGLDAGMHHLSNVLYHAINVVLLFLGLHLMTGSLWRSAFAASLFALHPVNVDTVAWITERKNLLSTTFWLLTIIAYWFYTIKPSVTRYCLVALAFCLGLLAKPMLITLPFTLLLLDYWPLGRLRITDGQRLLQAVRSRDFMKLILEKIPLLAISVVFGFITLSSLAVTEQILSNQVAMSLKIENAIVSYAVYLSKMVWPTGLSIFHPFPVFVPAGKVVLSLALLLAISFVALYVHKSHPYIPVGWFWFLGTLVTVIGIVQGGLWPAYAERWAYVPYIGLFVAVAWTAPALLKSLGRASLATAPLALAVLVSLCALTWNQIGYWKDDYTLFSRSLALHADNYPSHAALASFYIGRKEYGKGLDHFDRALAISPGNPYLLYDKAELLVKMEDTDGAIRCLQDALLSKPDHVDSRLNLGNLLILKGETDLAIEQYKAILQIDPGKTKAYNNLGNAYLRKSDLAAASGYFMKALELQPGFKDALMGLKKVEELQARYGQVSEGLEREIQADPGNPGPYLKLAALKQQQGDAEGALTAYRKALSIKPDSVAALYGMVLIHAGRQEYGQAIELLQSMRTIQPDNPENYYNLACMYARWNRPDEAISWLKQALDHGFANIDLIRKDPDLAGIRDTQFVKGLLAQEQTKGK